MLTRVSLDDLAACRMVSARWRRLTYEPGFARRHYLRLLPPKRHAQPLPRRLRLHRSFFLGVGEEDLAGVPAVGTPRPGLLRGRGRHARLLRVQAHHAAVAGPAQAQPARAVPHSVHGHGGAALRRRRRRVQDRALLIPIIARPGTADDALRGVRLAAVRVAPSRRRGAVPVLAGPLGAAHWLRWPDPCTGKQDVFAFDVRTETWRLIPLPRVEEHWWARKMIVAVEGRLCLLVTTEEDDGDEVVEVWEMASYVQGRWEKKMTVGGGVEGRPCSGTSAPPTSHSSTASAA
ncbi:hypothetical protein QOZ80_8AG0639930 [Eleusine coracana subsp. coracana]|nr:hypothetical protein QOZ80_8AG0639930 [Eleusine coracana subsp. coracana]